MNKQNMCITNIDGGKHNCDCSGVAKKCKYGESKPSSIICRFVKFVHNNTLMSFPVCQNKKARTEEKIKEKRKYNINKK